VWNDGRYIRRIFAVYCSHAVWVAKSRTRGPGFVFVLGKTRTTESLVDLPLERSHLEATEREKIMLNWILAKYIVRIIELLKIRVLNFQILLPLSSDMVSLTLKIRGTR
jgi:hypothetical protein